MKIDGIKCGICTSEISATQILDNRMKLQERKYVICQIQVQETNNKMMKKEKYDIRALH